MNSSFIKSILALCFILYASMIVAQSQPPSPPATPIDGGLGLLLVGEATYGLKKLRDVTKKN